MKAGVVESSYREKILHRINRKGKGWAFTPHDFTDLGDPRTVGMALTRLVREGKIRRLSRGVYDRPHDHPLLGKAGATTDSVVTALARKKNLRVLPSTALAANRLGLSTQVPAQMVYHTDGSPSTVKLDRLNIVFRRNTGSLLALAGRSSGLAAQALRDIGKNNVLPNHISSLRAALSPSAKKELLQDLNRVPAWIRPHFIQIAG